MSSTASLSSKVGASAGSGRLRAVGGQAVCAAAADELTREVADPGGDTGTAWDPWEHRCSRGNQKE